MAADPTTGPPAAPGADPPVVSDAGRVECAAVTRVRDFLAWLPSAHTACVDDRSRIDLLAALESAKGGLSATQARLTADFAQSQTAAAQDRAATLTDQPDNESADAAAKAARRKTLLGRSIRGQVALARKDAPHKGGAHLNLAKALTTDLQFTMGALTRGEISEWQATLISRETGCLSAEHRRQVDTELALHLGVVGDKKIGEKAREAAYRLDPQAVSSRLRQAVRQRRVTLRHAPDSMAYLTALLPAATATICQAALAAAADTQIAAGDPQMRGRGQLIADELTHRLSGGLISGCDDDGTPLVNAPATNADVDTADGNGNGAAAPPATGTATTSSATDGQSADTASESPPAGDDQTKAPPPRPAPPPLAPGSGATLAIHVHLVMTDKALLGCGDEPAELIGYGVIPATLARRIAAADLGPAATTWIRRLFTHPDTGQLAAMDSRSRDFPTSLKHFLLARDRRCRDPYCGAPGRHPDHVVSHADGGPTSTGNGQLNSADCNWTKEADGWQHTVETDGTITITTPTGHHYPSPQPAPPRATPWITGPADPATITAENTDNIAGTNAAADAEWKRRIGETSAITATRPPDNTPRRRRRPTAHPKPTRLRPPPINKERVRRRLDILKTRVQ